MNDKKKKGAKKWNCVRELTSLCKKLSFLCHGSENTNNLNKLPK